MIKKIKVIIVLFLLTLVLISVSNQDAHACFLDVTSPGAQLPETCP